MAPESLTESPSLYRHLDKMSIHELLMNINEEDKKVPGIISGSIEIIKALVAVIVDKMIKGGRLFYIGAGTSGRLGILDAAECPPTFGIPPGMIIGIIAGGNPAVTQAVEFAEDDTSQGWLDLKKYNVNKGDVVVGISASGTTPYVIAALEACREHQISTGSISCNPGSPLSKTTDLAIELVTGPEFITGSTRMKAGTAQKLVLNMISTSVMILLGRVEDSSMVNMQLTNEKLIDRGVKMIMEKLHLDTYEQAKEMLLRAGSVKKAIEKYHL